MIQQVVLGVWVCIATLGGIYGADFLFSSGGPTDNTVNVGGMAYSKSIPVTVPVLSDGNVDGYVVAQFVYGIRDTVDSAVAERVEPHFIDSVFRVLYNQERGAVRGSDLEALKNEVLERVNASLGGKIVEEALIDQINFISSEQVRCSRNTQ